MDSVKEGIRRNLVELLALSGKRNVDLAEACGVKKSAVSNWLSGNSSIDIERIPKICDFLGVTVDEFFGRSKEMQPKSALSSDEQELVALYRLMPEDLKRNTLESARVFAGYGGVREKQRGGSSRVAMIP